MNSSYTLEELVTDSLNGVIIQAIGNVPFIGGIIQGVLSGIEQKRAREFIHGMVERVNRIDSQKVDEEYVKSEEFIDLLSQAIRARIRHRSKEKAEVLLRLINDSICLDRSRRYEADFKETFIWIIDQLTQSEMIFLADFSKGVYQEKCKSDVYKSERKSDSIALDGLVSKGLLGDDDTWDKHVKATSLGEEFLDYLKYLDRY